MCYIYLLIFFISVILYFILKKNYEKFDNNKYYYTKQFSHNIKNNIPFTYVKLGDGEYLAIVSDNGNNCDGEQYSLILKEKLKESVRYFGEYKNIYVGAWNDDNIINFFTSLSPSLQLVNYHSIIIDKYTISNDDLLNLFINIKNSNRQKIYISNELMIKAKSLLNLDKIININLHGWFKNDYENIKNKLFNSITTEYPLILTSAGMGSKVLIKECREKYPNGIYIDIGSCLDFLLTKKYSRVKTFTYEEVENYFKSILPDDWNHPKYDYIYKIAKNEIGIHL